ncbi:MAG: ABC transporter transmembrane domain-containing protein [Gammaproteobacteria bacterium]|nr:ABC transporter transmembrane domain-containing protein [Gammaproteobacteria bacterium]
MSKVKPLTRSLPFLRPYGGRLLFAFACLTIAALAALAMPVSIRLVVDHGFSGENVQTLDIYFIALLVLSLIYALSSSLRYYTVMWIGERVVADIRSAVYEHVIKMDPAFFEVTKSGEVLSRLTTDTTLVQSVVGAGVSIALRSSFIVAGSLIMLFVTSSRLSMLLFGLLPLVVLPVWFYGKKVRKLSRETQDRVADSSGIAGEVLNAIHIVQAFTMESLQSRRFSDAVERSFQAARQRLSVGALLSGLIVLTAFSAIVIVLWTGARFVIDGSISAGTLVQFLFYATLVAGSTSALGEVWSDVQRAAGAMERLMGILDQRPAITSSGETRPFPAAGKNHLVLENVGFSYPSRPGQLALDGFSLDITPGETLALVGPSGAGKSTVFQLLLRFYDPRSGSIRLDDVDIRVADLGKLRKRIGIVPQQTVLFAGSVMENIRFGNPQATDEEVVIAAKAAHADQFIGQLPRGYQALLGEKGARLSGGQQQRIAIARAVLKDPPILLLDEATSSLDAESESLLQQALQELMVKRTVIVIAHRLATVKKVDRIIVMDKGRMVDSGTHDSLTAKEGIYARLAELQFD